MKNKITAYFITFFLLTFVFSVKAQNTAQNNSVTATPTTINETNPVIKTPEKTMPACETIEAIIDNKVLTYSSAKPDYLTKYQSLWVTVSGFSQKAKILGYDTTTLDSDLVKLENLISTFDKTTSTFIKNLTSVNKYVCNSNETYYVNSFKLTKDSLSNVRDSARSLYNFYEENLKVDIESLDKVTEIPISTNVVEDTTNE